MRQSETEQAQNQMDESEVRQIERGSLMQFSEMACGVLQAIQSDSLRQIEDTRGVLAAKLELLEVEQARRLAEDDRKGYQECQEEVS